MKPLSGMHKRHLMTEAKRLVPEWWPGQPPHGSCILFAAVLEALAAKRHGVRLVPQAGTAVWQRVPVELDDGEVMTHFGYQWEGPQNRRRVLAVSPTAGGGIEASILLTLPEVHVWLGDPATHELVDATTGFFPAQADALLGMDWPGKKPPEWLWCRGKDMPDEASYEPSAEATIYVRKYTDRYWREAAERVSGLP